MAASDSTNPRKTPSFVIEIPLQATAQQLGILDARLQAARQLYNAVLGEALTRLNLMRDSELYQAAIKIPKSNKSGRTEAFNQARSHYRYTEYALHTYANNVAISSKWIKQHLDVHVIQKNATRAFKATERIIFGQAKKVRFKSQGQFASVEGKSNATGIRWRGNRVEWNSTLHQLKIPAIINQHDPVILHGLNSRIKYVRLVKRELNKKTYWFAQLVCEGKPYQKPKNQIGQGLVGLDLGVSTVAIVGDKETLWEPFAEELNNQQQEIRRLQRRMERSRRANNPNNYNPNFLDAKGKKKKGTIKKGKKFWNNSNHYRRVAAKKREMSRKQVAHRKSLHGWLVNKVLTLGNNVKLEKVSIKGWQKIFGKSIGYKAPGYFQSELIRKAENAGGTVLQFSTQKTALSQTCLCGRKEKKPLRVRVHNCPDCGVSMQRDIISAFLSRYIDPSTETLSFESARNGWLGMEQSLQAGWQRGSNKLSRTMASPESPNSDIGLEIIACNPIGNREAEVVRLNETCLSELEPPDF